MPDRTNLLFVIHTAGVISGGAEKAFKELAVVMKDMGFCIYAVTSPYFSEKDTLRKAGIFVIERQLMHSYDPFQVLFLRSVIKKYGISLVMSSNPLSDFISAAAARLTGIKHVLTVQATGRYGDLPIKGAMMRLKNIYMRYYDLFSLKNASGIIAVSETIKKEILAVTALAGTGSKTIFIGNPVDCSVFSPLDRKALRKAHDIPDNRFIIGAGGRLTRQKGLEYLLGACALLKRRRTDFLLLIAGDGPLKEKLVHQAGVQGLDNFVRFTGYSRKMNEFYNLCDIFVLPSLWEGMPLAVLESMACGVPAIAAEVSGIRETIKDGVNGWIVPCKDSQSIYLRLFEHINNPAALPAVGKKARDFVLANYDSKVIADKTSVYLRKILS